MASYPAAMEERQPLKDKDIHCLGHLRRVFDLLDGLADIGCERDRAGNRKLFFNTYCKLVLLYIWNPLIGSIRGLQQAAQLATVSRALGIGRFSLGSFSESVRAFEPERLKPIIEELAGQVLASAPDSRLEPVEHALTLVDGTVMTGLSRLVKSACGAEGRYNTARDGRAVYGWRLHTQLDLETLTPHRIDRTAPRNAGENRQSNVLRRTLEKHRPRAGTEGAAMPTRPSSTTLPMPTAASSPACVKTASLRKYWKSGCSPRKRWTRGWCGMRSCNCLTPAIRYGSFWCRWSRILAASVAAPNKANWSCWPPTCWTWQRN